ncbi:thiol-disulfide isomerase-like thioredoxin [Desulfitobacterium dichloroeliminans LMG P-21439]|uniref:Thiol-disulfide isomerase-like thioredoxin n=1 Tax=Desulfitobacterium dichloroeliminans (strain LMG P-21439 / DCA1) TaxID=871963 RepID=L0F790_DESDL|nr:TlpA disulfide reductase family protein [Desulfitobacterium dichloroeliminans]AGA69042.1 thiol-disulfide isomerase-like thioredoxin [Desulfitobacterium dichloroeliminans LMG P-21439]
MNSKVKMYLGIVAFILFLGGAYAAYSSLSEKVDPSQGAPINQEVSISQDAEKDSSANKSKLLAADFTVYGTDGTPYKLSDFQGKPVVLNFWASWCPPCREEMPHFNDVYQDHKQDVVFLMVDLVDGQRETEESGINFVQEQGYDFPIYIDKNLQAATIYGVTTIPTTLFIDAEGYVFTGYKGPLKKSTLETVVNSMLKK